MNDTLTTVTNSFSDPSVLHWFALFFGDWVRELFNSEAGDGTNHAVTALMVSLTTMNITAMVALLIVVGYTGGKAMFSGMMTANLTTNISKFLPIRLITAFVILMPTTLGLTSLNSFNLSIGYGQANVVRVALMGGAVADWSWNLTAQALVRFNLGGNPISQNTVLRSKKLAQMFVCNEYFYQQKQSEGVANINKFSYKTTPLVDLPTGHYQTPPAIPSYASNISDIPIPSSTNKDIIVDILFGGEKGDCGSVKLTQLQEVDSSSVATTITSLKTVMSDLQFKMQRSANLEFLTVLQEYQTFAERYRDTWGDSGTQGLISFITDNESGEQNKVKYVELNYGNLQSTTGGTNNEKLNATADALIYLAQNLSETQVYIGGNSKQIIESEMLSSDGSGSSSEALSESVFTEFLNGYISAGMFWSIYQELSSLMFDSVRYANSISADQRSDYEGIFCDSPWYDLSFSDEAYVCEEQGQVDHLFEVIFDRSAKKGEANLFASQFTMSNGAIAYANPVMWSSFHSSSIQSPKEAKDSGLGFISDVMIGTFDTALNGINALQYGDNGTLVSGSSVDRPYNSAFNFNLSGTESPYTMLNNLGESLRDIYFLGNASMIVLKATGLTVKDRAKKLADDLSISVPVSWFISFVGNVAYESSSLIIANLSKLLSAVGFAVLVLIYGIPAIPIIGWTFIVLGVFYTVISAVGAIPFSAILIAIPKGDDLFSPDTERILSLLYGIFIRQSIIVVGFVASLFVGYVGLSLFKLVWLGTFLPRLDGIGFVDTPFAVIFIIIGFAFGVFAICMYSFRVTSNIVDTIGSWFSSHLVGAFGSNQDDISSATTGIKNLSSQLDSISSMLNQNNDSDSSGKKKKKNDPKTNA